ncbi:CPBP family intramembrane glutamic endopeptidase [Saccharopolyspora sp. NPDC000359]|uniref:CPBP family intramembrane glutamic endopeptidase n=1 Tax=Saccharopolyspora sp. NPDC000359 TaxID=3154251 RepID=UPI00333211A3
MTTEITAPPRWQRVVARRPLTAFFTLAYAISWLAWTPYVLGANGLGVLPLHFPQLAGSTQLAGILPGAYLGPLAAACLVTYLTEGRAGLRAWRRRLLTWRLGARWYALVLVVFPAVILAGMLVLPGALQALTPPTAGLLTTYLLMLVLQVLTSGLAEEPGWRDFALVRYQQRHGPLLGTLILGPLWAGWHLPLFLTEWAGQPVTVAFLVRFLLLAVALSTVITWVFNRTRQGLLLIILLHAGFNSASAVLVTAMFPGFVRSWGPVLACTALALVIVAATRGQLGYHQHRAQR